MQDVIGPHSLVIAHVIMLDGSDALGRRLAPPVYHNILGALSRFQGLRREAALLVKQALLVVRQLAHNTFTVFVDHKIDVLLTLPTTFGSG